MSVNNFDSLLSIEKVFSIQFNEKNIFTFFPINLKFLILINDIYYY